MDETPRAIDRYTIEAVLGEGGMGRVYRALDPRLGRRVALKVLLAEGASDAARAQAAARMAREARAAAAFNHPNVVAIYEIGEVDGSPFIAMGLVTGVTLRDAFADPIFPAAQRLMWLLDVARGLGAAHRAGLVHRDVKPENVMITSDGVVKILDFGIARASEGTRVDPSAPTSGAELSTLTAGGVALGTPQYMAPEQLQSEPLDGRTDQFAWAVTAWEMLAGSLPWGSKMGAQLIAAVLSAPVRSLREVVPEVEPKVSDAIGRALAKRREDRFATMEELIVAIEGEGARVSPGSSAKMQAQRGNTEPTMAQVTKPSPKGAPSIRPSAPLRGRFAIGGAVVLAGVAWLAVRAGAWGKEEHAASAASAVASGAAPPASKIAPEAQPFFARAAQFEREGRHDNACREYMRAADVAPTSGEAALALAMCKRNDPRGGRVYFRRAWAMRASLSPRDAAVLDAYEPYFQRAQPDFPEEKRRLEIAVEHFPNDAELRYFLAGAYRLDSMDVKRAVLEIQRSLELDPKPHVMSIEADFHSYDGDFPAAHDAVERCLRIAPDSLDCLGEEVWLDSEEGNCAKAESAARRMLVIEPEYLDGVRALANAVYAQGGSLEAVRELFRRVRATDAGAGDTRLDDAHMAMLAGDFVTAERLVRWMADDAQSSAVAADHGVPAKLLVAIGRETGRDAEAATVARAYLDGRDAWEPNPDFDDWAMADEPTPMMLAARRRAGAMSKSAYDAEIARTVERWKIGVTPATRSFIWIYAYAAPAETAEDATIALARQADLGSLPKFKPLSLADEAIGRTYALAGHVEDARAAFERATKSCAPLDHPMEHTRAYFEMGTLREARGETDGACAAYHVVRDRWGAARPRSLTAQKAAARIAALKCKE